MFALAFIACHFVMCDNTGHSAKVPVASPIENRSLESYCTDRTVEVDQHTKASLSSDSMSLSTMATLF